MAPAELETILLDHPSVKDAAVIGVPDEEAGELPLAFVVRQLGAKISGEEIKQFVASNGNLPYFLYQCRPVLFKNNFLQVKCPHRSD